MSSRISIWFRLMPSLILSSSVIALFCLIQAAAAQTAGQNTTVPDCTVQGSGGPILVLVCPPGLSAEEWVAAGRSACAASPKMCNAWIWDDASLAPEKVPSIDLLLSDDDVKNAVAVWIDDAQRLMTMRRVDN